MNNDANPRFQDSADRTERHIAGAKRMLGASRAHNELHNMAEGVADAALGVRFEGRPYTTVVIATAEMVDALFLANKTAPSAILVTARKEFLAALFWAAETARVELNAI